MEDELVKMVNSTSPTFLPSIRPDANRRLVANQLHSPDLDIPSTVVLPGDEAIIDPPKIEHSGGSTGGGGSASSPIKNQRASSKRRSIKIKFHPLDDGYMWRKYLQKEILGHPFPRGYYRCNHRFDQGCRAVKQVQKVSDEPDLYNITYSGKHTCREYKHAPLFPSSAQSNSQIDLSLGLGVGRSSEVIVSTLKSEQLQEKSTLSTINTSNNNNIYGDAPFPMASSSSSCFTYDHQDIIDSPFNKQSMQGESEDEEGDAGRPSRYWFHDLPSFKADDDSSFRPSNVMLQDDDESPNDSILDEMMDCFSIFFLIPTDYDFEEDTLLQLWMAKECVEDDSEGQKNFNFLLNGEYLLHSGTNYVTKKARYRINTPNIKDLLDLQGDINTGFYLKWENESHRNITNFPEIQHVSLVQNDFDESVFRTLEQFPELKTLLFLHNYGQAIAQIPDQLFSSLQKLQALDLSGTQIKKLSSFIGNLIHLHYLDLSGTLIEWLPDTLCSLKELQTLKLRGCSKLRGLPRQLKRLTKLRHLDVDVLRQLATIPRGMGALVNLRTLSAFLVGTEDGFKIQELKELNSLTGDFCIAMLENVDNGDDAMEAALYDKKYLHKLELRWTASQLLRTNNNCYDVLKWLHPCPSLKELQIFCYQGSKFPKWVGHPTFDQLVSITFFKCEHVSELPLIEELPFLRNLELVKMNGVQKIERRGQSEDPAFVSLEKLEVDEMQSLRCWNWVKTNEDDFKSLVELTINDCPGLREFHVFPCLSSIKHLEVKGCPKLESLSVTKLPDSLEDLIVEECPMIKRKYSQRGGEDWQKIQHVSNIRICEEEEDDDEC